MRKFSAISPTAAQQAESFSARRIDDRSEHGVTLFAIHGSHLVTDNATDWLRQIKHGRSSTREHRGNDRRRWLRSTFYVAPSRTRRPASTRCAPVAAHQRTRNGPARRSPPPARIRRAPAVARRRLGHAGRCLAPAARTTTRSVGPDSQGRPPRYRGIRTPTGRPSAHDRACGRARKRTARHTFRSLRRP